MGVGESEEGYSRPSPQPPLSSPFQVPGPQQLQPLQQPLKLRNLVSVPPQFCSQCSTYSTALSCPLFWGLGAPSSCHILTVGLLTHLPTFREWVKSLIRKAK